MDHESGETTRYNTFASVGPDVYTAFTLVVVLVASLGTNRSDFPLARTAMHRRLLKCAIYWGGGSTPVLATSQRAEQAQTVVDQSHVIGMPLPGTLPYLPKTVCLVAASSTTWAVQCEASALNFRGWMTCELRLTIIPLDRASYSEMALLAALKDGQAYR